ncbi:MAG: AI-2E family transporter, partial [Clostridiales bacterium]|nr:AI-2E family transporter [Clostridiales bacterium]
PYFGPIVGAIPACLVVLMNDPAKIILTILVVLIVQQIENHLLTPYVMGNTTNIHPVIVIMILWVASYFFSFFGFLLGVPLFIILREFCKFFYRTLVKAEKENAY